MNDTPTPISADVPPAPATIPVLHFVITRFNLHGRDAGAARMIDPVYLDQRLDLFERFCYRTLKSQTRQDFRWLVLFADDTPAVIRERIARYADWPNFVPVYLPPDTSHVGRQVVAPYLDDSACTLVTTRVDNDDGLCRTYIEDVRRFDRTAERIVLQFPVGFVWHEDRVYLDRQEHNAFTTLIEPLPAGRGSEFLTIYKGSHSDIAQLGRVIDVGLEPAWMQVIHGTNAFNFVRGRRHRIADMPQRFDIALPSGGTRESTLEILLDRLRTPATSTLSRFLRAVKYRLLRADDTP